MLTSFLVTALIAGASSAAPVAPKQAEYGFSGDIGHFPIAMVVSVGNGSDLVSAHYSYASQQKSIPLRQTMNGQTILLTEPGGGVFDLHFTTSRGAAGSPLTFYTSTGLSGTWNDGRRQLPVKLTLMFANNDVSTIEDCELYPAPAPPKGPHFPNPGCKHTPDKAILDKCIADPFTTDAATTECISRSTVPCQNDQYDVNFCAGNIDDYLSQVAEQRLRPGGTSGRIGIENYHQWEVTATSDCTKTSPFSRSGSGYGGDIAICMAAKKLRLIQKGWLPRPPPGRKSDTRLARRLGRKMISTVR